MIRGLPSFTACVHRWAGTETALSQYVHALCEFACNHQTVFRVCRNIVLVYNKAVA
jgi:hypothetical protein